MLSPMMQCAGRIRVKDCPFGAPDGTANQFQLVDRHGHAVTKDVQIASIHQTDWQGRVELSDQPRTNYATGPTRKTLNQGVNNGFAVGLGISDPLGGTAAISESLDLTGSGATVGVNTGVYWARVDIQPPGGFSKPPWLIVGLRSPNGASAKIGDNTEGWIGWLSTGAIPTEWTYFKVQANTTTPSYFKIYFDDGATQPDNPQIDIFAPTVTETAGVVIPTTSSRVTVTDYTANATGQITLGQAPQGESSPGAGDAAVLDWTGSARRAA